MQCAISRFARVFPAILLNFISYLQKLVMEIFDKCLSDFGLILGDHFHNVGKLHIILEPYSPRSYESFQQIVDAYIS